MEARMPLMRVKKVKVLRNYVVQFTFSNGDVRDIDLERFLHGGMFEEVRNPAYFRKVRVVGDSIAWPNQADIDPNVLYYGLKTAREAALEQRAS